jgi:hypothetical protein
VSADVHSLMRPTPTGDHTGVDQLALRPEFAYQAHSGSGAETIDAPEWMPAGGCYSWVGRTDTIYLQPHGFCRSNLEAA